MKGSVTKIIIAVFVIAGLGAGSFFAYKKLKNTDNSAEQSQYREYKTEKGSITVGISESGTVSLDRQYVTFPTGADIDDVFVKVGVKVSEGDNIALFNVDDITEACADYESRIASAELQLKTAQTDAVTKLADAKSTYDSTLADAELANNEYSISLAQSSSDISSANNKLTEDRKSLTEYKSLSNSYPTDYATLQEYENKIDEYEDVYKEYEKVYKSYETEYRSMEKIYSGYQDEYNDLYDVYENYEKIYKEYEKVYSSYEDEYQEYQTDLEQLQSEYDEYLSDISEQNEKITSLKNAIDTAQKNVEEAQTSYNEALESYNLAVATSSNVNSSITTTTQTNTSSASTTSTNTSTDNNSNTNNTTNNNNSSNNINTLKSKVDSAATALSKAESKLVEAKHSYTGYYQNLGRQISNKIDEYEDKTEEIKDKMEDISDKMADYKKNTMKPYQTMMENYKEDTLDPQTKKADTYKSDTMAKYQTMMSDYKADVMEPYQEFINDYKEQYNDFKSDFQDTYGNLDGDDINDKIYDLNNSIETDQLNIDKANASHTSNVMSSEIKRSSTLAAADIALDTYNNKVAEINEAVEEKQKNYDDLVSEYQEFLDEVDSGGYIHSPCNGIISAVNVSTGDSYTANQQIATVMDLSGVYISLSVSEDDINSVYVGQECSITLSAFENKTFSGEIDTISAEPARSSGSVSYTVTVKVDSDGETGILEGMSADVTFISKQVTGVMYVNENAVKYHDGSNYVLVYDENGNVTEKAVKTGFSDGKYVEIISGLSVGDKVLAESAVKG